MGNHWVASRAGSVLQCFGRRGDSEQGCTVRQHLHVKVQIWMSLRKAEPTVDILTENISLENDDQGVGRLGGKRRYQYTLLYTETPGETVGIIRNSNWSVWGGSRAWGYVHLLWHLKSRREVLTEKEQPYVSALRAGCGERWEILRLLDLLGQYWQEEEAEWKEQDPCPFPASHPHLMVPSETPNRNSTTNNSNRIAIEFELQHRKAEDGGCTGVEGTRNLSGIWVTLVLVVMRQMAGTRVR